METEILTQSPAGEKNIYYDQSGNRSFNLVDFGFNDKKINEEAIYDFLLYGAVLPPNTVRQDIYAMFPGEQITVDEGQITRDNQLYKQFSQRQPLDKDSNYFVNQLDELLTGYFSAQRKIHKKIGLFLSGGVDSGILASYLQPADVSVSWAGWGPTTTDYLAAKTIAEKFNLKNHLVVFPDYEKDERLFVNLVGSRQEPFKLTALPYFRMAQQLQEFAGEKVFCLTGDNADTAAGSFGEVVRAYKLSRVNKTLKYFPWRWFYDWQRKLFLLATDNPLALSAWFHSNGIFPGPWLTLPPKYFLAKRALVESQLDKKIHNFNDYVLMGMLSTGVVRQMSGIRSVIYRKLGAEFGLPYCDQRIVEMFLQVSPSIRKLDNFGKIILKKLAVKRAVPQAIIVKGKKGISYGYKDYLKQKRHLPLWDEMERHQRLNEFINIKMIRQKHQDNFFAFDVLRSLHYYLLTLN